MRYWHYLRKSFKSSPICLNNWSHKPVKIISNNSHHTSQVTATQHTSVSLQWSESCCSHHSGTQCAPCPLHPRSHCNLFTESTLNMTLYIRKTLIPTLRWGSIVIFLFRPFSSFSQAELSSMSWVMQILVKHDLPLRGDQSIFPLQTVKMWE